MRKNLYSEGSLLRVIILISMVSLLVSCTALREPQSITFPEATRTSSPTSIPTVDSGVESLSEDQVATLSSLEMIDDYPLYTMRYFGTYDRWLSTAVRVGRGQKAALPQPGVSTCPPAWGCSLFAALGDKDNMLYGRNFDWQYSPAVLLFTQPPDGYASLSMVDIAYLGFTEGREGDLTNLPLIERKALLNSPFLPFDGMNERGLAIGMAAVPSGEMQPDPGKETIDSLRIIRIILDQASSVDDAVAILKNYNIDMGSGPPLHYLVADRSGKAVLVEFYQGRMVVTPNEDPWHLATNFIRASVQGSPDGQCWRYDLISQWLAESGGRLEAGEALDLLTEVSQYSTQWSVVYEMNRGQVQAAMGRQFDQVHTLASIFGDQ